MTFTNWLARAKRGDWFQYYRGFLLRDLDRASGRSYDIRVAQVAHAAWHAYETGRALLVQRRLADNDYLYFVVRL